MPCAPGAGEAAGRDLEEAGSIRVGPARSEKVEPQAVCKRAQHSLPKSSIRATSVFMSVSSCASFDLLSSRPVGGQGLLICVHTRSNDWCDVFCRPVAPASLNRQDSDSKKPKAEPHQPAGAAPPGAGKPAGADASRPAANGAQPASSQAAASPGGKSLLVASDFAELDTPPTVFRKAPPKESSQAAKKVGGASAFVLLYCFWNDDILARRLLSNLELPTLPSHFWRRDTACITVITKQRAFLHYPGL